METKKRKNTRNKVWPETLAHIEYRDKMALNTNSLVKTRATVANMSASGLFLNSEENIPTDTELTIIIDFDPGAENVIAIKVTGVVVRREKRGVAIKFTKIDTQKLGECILAKLNAQK
jgi:hypothetical protein